MRSKQIEALHNRLLNTKQELLAGVAAVNEHSNEEFAGDVPDLNDEASRTYSRQVQLSIGEVDRNQLKLVNEALSKIEKDPTSYGVCMDCEEEIPIERLKVAPYVKRCKECKEAWESTKDEEQ